MYMLNLEQLIKKLIYGYSQGQKSTFGNIIYALKGLTYLFPCIKKTSHKIFKYGCSGFRKMNRFFKKYDFCTCSLLRFFPFVLTSVGAL